MPDKPKGMKHVFHLIEDFLELWTLNIGIKLGLFNYLKEQPSSTDHLAENLDMRLELIQTWCDTMWACGYLKKEDNIYSLTRWSKYYLWKRSPTYIGFTIESIDTLFPPFIAFNEKFSRAKPFPSYSSQHMQDIVQSIAPVAKSVVPILIKEAPILKEAIKILDIGCGSGSYLITMAKYNTKLQGLGLDKEGIIIQSAEKWAKKKGLQDRIKFLQANILNFNIAEKFDCILISNVLQSFTREINIQLLSHLSSNLTADGSLVILECLLDESRTIPKYGVLFNMYLRMESLKAQTYTLSEIKTMLEKSSFRFQSHKPIAPGLDLIFAQLAV